MKKEKVNFLKTNKYKIVQECLKHEDKVGYLTVFVSRDYTIDSMVFNPGTFNADKFHIVLSSADGTTNNDLAVQASYVYFRIAWMEDETALDVKELIVLRESREHTKFT